jgi:hypothetical protein
MNLNSLLAAGAAAGLVAWGIMYVVAPKSRLVLSYAVSLPAFVLAYVLVFGQTGLDLLPVWLIRPLMYFTVAPAATTVVMLVFTAGVRVRNVPLNGWFVCNLAYRLTWLFAAGCMIYSALNRNGGAILLHVLGAGYGMAIAALARSKYPKPPASPSKN